MSRFFGKAEHVAFVVPDFDAVVARLIVSFTPIPCDFWTFQLCNIWQKNFDNSEEWQGFLHPGNGRIETDGTVTMIIAHRDPPIGGTWIDPYGHTQGGWSFRLIKTHGLPPPPVPTWKVYLADLQRERLCLLGQVEPLVSGEVL